MKSPGGGPGTRKGGKKRPAHFPTEEKTPSSGQENTAGPGRPPLWWAGRAKYPRKRPAKAGEKARKRKRGDKRRGCGLKRGLKAPGNAGKGRRLLFTGVRDHYSRDHQQVTGQQEGGGEGGPEVSPPRIRFSEGIIAENYEEQGGKPEKTGAGALSPLDGSRGERRPRRRRPAGGRLGLFPPFAALPGCHRAYFLSWPSREARRWRVKSSMPRLAGFCSAERISSMNCRLRLSPTAPITSRDWLRRLTSGDFTNS